MKCAQPAAAPVGVDSSAATLSGAGCETAASTVANCGSTTAAYTRIGGSTINGDAMTRRVTDHPGAMIINAQNGAASGNASEKSVCGSTKVLPSDGGGSAACPDRHEGACGD